MGSFFQDCFFFYFSEVKFKINIFISVKFNSKSIYVLILGVLDHFTKENTYKDFLFFLVDVGLPNVVDS